MRRTKAQIIAFESAKVAKSASLGVKVPSTEDLESSLHVLRLALVEGRCGKAELEAVTLLIESRSRTATHYCLDCLKVFANDGLIDASQLRSLLPNLVDSSASKVRRWVLNTIKSSDVVLAKV